MPSDNSHLTYFTILGAVVLIGAVYALSTDRRTVAAVGLVLGAGTMIVSEWTRWRSRG